MGNQLPKISLVMPVHNEQENIAPMCERLSNALLPLGGQYTFEVLYVDDGSTDATIDEINKWTDKQLPVGYVKLSRNFGHQAALEAGLAHATGDAVITLDGDMQHPPEYIPSMLDEYAKGADVVQMARSNMTDNMKGIVALTFYKLFNSLPGTKLVPNAADFRLLSRRVIKAFLGRPGHGKFIRAIIPTLGFKQVQLEYKEVKRQFGSASYTYFDSFELALHALFKFSRLPAYLVTFMGFLLLFVGGLYSLLMLTGAITETGHRFDLSLALLLAGCVFLSAGVICFYLYFLLEQVRQVPHYIVSEVIIPNQSV